MIKRILLITSLLFAALLAGCASESMISPVPLANIPGINHHVLQLAEKAYYNAACKGDVEKPYLIIVDFSKPSTQKRLWVINMKTKKVLFYTYVSHGKNSGFVYAKHFSNTINSLQSSIGVMQTSYAYNGTVGYSMKLKGLEPGFNDNVYKRLIVVHGATYVGSDYVHHNGYLGRTWGCFAVNPSLLRPFINTTKNGSILFAYYPNKNWLEHSKFLNGHYCK